MHTIDANGVTLEYEDRGAGEPVLLIHGGVFAATFSEMISERSLASYRLTRPHRRGLGGLTAQ
jgi:pimeloyl-ACP methyl ester carboxylesterase